MNQENFLPMKSIFSSKQYILFVVTLGIFLDTFSYSIVIPFFPKSVKEFGGEEKDVGIILSFFSVGMLLGSIVFGFISDRSNYRKSLMVGGLGILITSSLLMGFIKTLWALAIGRFLQGLSSGIIWVLGLALIADTHSPSEMGMKMGFIFSAYTVGNFLGPIVGGPLYQYLGYVAPFAMIAILGVMDGFARIVLQEPPKQISQVQPLSVIHSLKFLFKNVPLMWIFALTATSGLFIGSLEVAITLFLEKRYLFQPDQVGYAFLVLAIPEMLMGPVAGFAYDKFGFKKVTIPGLIFTALFTFLMAMNLPLVGFLVLLGIMAGFLMFGLSPLLPEIVHCVPESMYGASYGLFNCAFAIGLLVGPIIASVLFQFAGWEVYIYVVGSILLLNVIIPVIYQRTPLEDVSVSMDPIVVQVE
jgi:MFS family permease